MSGHVSSRLVSDCTAYRMYMYRDVRLAGRATSAGGAETLGLGDEELIGVRMRQSLI